jgi:hypothetical protein
VRGDEGRVVAALRVQRRVRALLRIEMHAVSDDDTVTGPRA